MKLLSFVALAVLFFQAAVSPLQQPQRPQASIEGTVTRSGAGQPVPSARVTLTRRGGGTPLQQVPGQPVSAGARGAPSPPIPSVMTDDRGRFTFSALEEGIYTLQVQANGYVVRYYGQRSAVGQGTPITLSANQAIRDANVELTPAATISGHVHDIADQPLINVPMQLLRYSYDYTGQRSYQSVATTQTDDRGQYRMYWVTPGRYYLLAGRTTTGNNALEALAFADRVGP